MLILFSFKYSTSKNLHISVLYYITYNNINSSENHIDEMPIPKNKLKIFYKNKFILLKICGYFYFPWKYLVRNNNLYCYLR